MDYSSNLNDEFIRLFEEYKHLNIDGQIDHDKFYLYSLVTHSTAIEGSTITEFENQIMFEQGISIQGKSIVEQNMNIDLKNAYDKSKKWAMEHKPVTMDMLKSLAGVVMRNTGQTYNTALGSFSSADGDFRLLNVTAGVGGKSYMNYSKIPDKLKNLCGWINEARENASQMSLMEKYFITFDAHYELATIHPWADGNGRMARLLMNHLQFEMGLIPSRILKEDKAEYIKSLVDTRENEDYDLFRNFMVRNMVRNLKADIDAYKKSIGMDDGAAGKMTITDTHIFKSKDDYKVSCRINGERQLGATLSRQDKDEWEHLLQSSDTERKNVFIQQMVEKHFNKESVARTNELKL